MNWDKRKKEYQKAVTSKKDFVAAIEAIEPAAKQHWAILKIKPVKVPGVPAKSFIYLPYSYQISES